jgi:hypothetical protein
MHAVSPLGRRRVVALSVVALVLVSGMTTSCGVSGPIAGGVKTAGTAPGSSAARTTAASREQTPGAVVGSTPPRRGPGAVLDFDPKTAPVVPKGMTVDAYIAAYYQALIDKEWRTAFGMVPKTDPTETLADFRTLQYGYEVGSFTIIGRVAGAALRVLVVHVTPGNGVWNTTWAFVRTRRGTVVKDLTYARPGGAGCH